MSGLLFVVGHVGDDVSGDEFNDWYNNEHAPARLTVPGINNALRYKALDGEQPAYIAMYDAESPSTFQSNEYKNLALNASKRERELIPKLKMLNRRIYELQSTRSKNNYNLNTPASFIQIITAFIDETETNFEEGIATIPGWLRTRLYRLISVVELGPGVGPKVTPNYLIIHDFDNQDFTTPDLEASHSCRNFYLLQEIKRNE